MCLSDKCHAGRDSVFGILGGVAALIPNGVVNPGRNEEQISLAEYQARLGITQLRGVGDERTSVSPRDAQQDGAVIVALGCRLCARLDDIPSRSDERIA